MARTSPAGFWLVFRGEAQWLAWRDWLHVELQRNFFPDKLPVPSEWPPTTVTQSTAVADYFRDVREKAKKDKDWPKSRTAETPIPIVPTPWVRWSEFEANARVAAFEAQENPPVIHRTQEEVDALLRSVGRMPARLRSPAPEASSDERQFGNLIYPEPRDDIAAVRRAALERRLAQTEQSTDRNND